MLGGLALGDLRWKEWRSLSTVERLVFEVLEGISVEMMILGIA